MATQRMHQVVVNLQLSASGHYHDVNYRVRHSSSISTLGYDMQYQIGIKLASACRTSSTHHMNQTFFFFFFCANMQFRIMMREENENIRNVKNILDLNIDILTLILVD